MEIGPTKPGGFSVNEPGNRRSQKEKADEPNHRLDAPTISAEGQSPRLTDSAAENHECCGGCDIDQESPPDLDKLLQIQQRIETGYYDQIWVKEKMIDRMIDEMLKNISEFYK